MTTHDDNNPDDAAGYGRPPKAHRFKKGKSGNPKGRPKGATSLNAHVNRELQKKVKVRVNGKPVMLKKGQIIAMALCDKALKMDMAALKLVNAIAGIASVEAQTADLVESYTLDATDMDILKAFFASEVQADTAFPEKGDGDVDEVG